MLVPFFFHWYDGDEPPLVGVAVKVTEVPAQILVVLGDIDTDGTTTEQAVIWALSILTYAELLLRVTAVTEICIEVLHESVAEVNVPEAVV